MFAGARNQVNPRARRTVAATMPCASASCILTSRSAPPSKLPTPGDSPESSDVAAEIKWRHSGTSGIDSVKFYVYIDWCRCIFDLAYCMVQSPVLYGIFPLLFSLFYQCHCFIFYDNIYESGTYYQINMWKKLM